MELPRPLPSLLSSAQARGLLLLSIPAVLFLLATLSHRLYSDGTWDGVPYKRPLAGFNNKGCTESSPNSSAPSQATSRFHFMIAASKPNKHFCRALVSSTVNRYGPPVIAGWHGEGALDAAETHLAKVRAVSYYLDNLPPAADDDLILLLDGYDVQLQLGPDVLIDRYYQAAALEDERIIQQLGPTLADKVAGPLGRHIFFGADKICWPVDFTRPACWAVPEVPNMDSLAFGPKTDGDEAPYFRPRWLNSGTIMGPVREARAFFRSTLDMINATWDAEFPFHESDQYYMAELWGLQETERINAQLHADPDATHPRGPDDAKWPTVSVGGKHNHHVAVDYSSTLFQTWAGYEEFVDWRPFAEPGFGRTIHQNVRGDANFRPWVLRLAGDAMAAIDRIFRSTDDPSMGVTSDELLARSEFGSNVVTRTIMPVYHCTGAKDALDAFYPRMWFYHHAQALLRSAIRHFRAGHAFAPRPVNGRTWYPAHPYPRDAAPDDGGAWADGSDGSGGLSWVDFGSMCKEHEADVFSMEMLG
ncbi:hypothetical protein F5X68DRAFT_46209 [Plectosphaerella plurivora]|uniref:Uncharacterized protein n=1 Tax=Plectosphaerella plurivora TaxID=936078 RepID=A0A9P9AFH7_9PEZI|nr:hypothetical protein F5X68DRAFT_46209 [Plectosphaerella plurivora]